MRLAGALLIALILGGLQSACVAERLPLPERSVAALSASQLIPILDSMSLEDRERRIGAEILGGNVPGWSRELVAVRFAQMLHGSNYSGTFFVSPDYLAIGSDTDYLIAPVTPIFAQGVADRLGCTLPTRKMVNMIWTNATVKLEPQPIPPSPAMITIPVFAAHNMAVRAQRDRFTSAHPFGALTAGHKKDVVISTKIYTNFATATRRPVVIYGWHRQSGTAIQPLYNGHKETYVDYSHGVRLVLNRAILNGTTVTVAGLLKDPRTAALLSDEGIAEGTTEGIIAVPGYPGAAK